MPFSSWTNDQIERPSPLTSGLLAAIWNRRNRALNDVAWSALNLAPSDRVLEVGFGGGYLLRRILEELSTGFLAGVDADQPLVNQAHKRYAQPIQVGRLDIQCAPAEALPFPDSKFNKVVSVNSILYWSDIPKALAEIQRVLERSGQLVLCFSDNRNLEPRSFDRRNINLVNDWEAHYLLERAGFYVTVVAHEQDAHRPFVCMLALKNPTKRTH